jgi:hypothetical protein
MDISNEVPFEKSSATGNVSTSCAETILEQHCPTSPSANVNLCLYLINYFTLCDSFLKFLPLSVGIALRYLPEAILYLLVFLLLLRRRRIFSFPLFWPLFACVLMMTVSGIVNHSEMRGVASDLRTFFRFSTLTYILWRTTITPERIAQFVDGFLGLTKIQLAIGALELVGGARTRAFFSPAVGWGNGTPAVSQFTGMETGSWLSGTLADYNHFGMFMTLSCILAIAMYSAKPAAKYAWIAAGAALAVILSFSRHSLLLLVVGVTIFLSFHRKTLLSFAKTRRFAFSAMCVLVILAIVGSTSSVLRERLASLGSSDVVAGDPDANIRLYMTLVLTPRFLSAYPFFGQGPFAATEIIPIGTDDRSLGPQMKAAPDLPGWATFFIGDVVWVMILGLYGCFGLIAFGSVFWSIAKNANMLRKTSQHPLTIALAQACIVAVVLFIVSGFFSEEMIARDAIPVFWSIAGITLSCVSVRSIRFCV